MITKFEYGPGNMKTIVNIAPDARGVLRTITPGKDAVVVHLIETTNQFEEKKLERLVTIECLNDQMLSVLQSEAKKIRQSLEKQT